MTTNSRDDRSELQKLLTDAIKYDWEIEIDPTPTLPPRKIVSAWRETLRSSKAPYRSRL